MHIIADYSTPPYNNQNKSENNELKISIHKDETDFLPIKDRYSTRPDSFLEIYDESNYNKLISDTYMQGNEMRATASPYFLNKLSSYLGDIGIDLNSIKRDFSIEEPGIGGAAGADGSISIFFHNFNYNKYLTISQYNEFAHRALIENAPSEEVNQKLIENSDFTNLQTNIEIPDYNSAHELISNYTSLKTDYGKEFLADAMLGQWLRIIPQINLHADEDLSSMRIRPLESLAHTVTPGYRSSIELVIKSLQDYSKFKGVDITDMDIENLNGIARNETFDDVEKWFSETFRSETAFEEFYEFTLEEFTQTSKDIVEYLSTEHNFTF